MQQFDFKYKYTQFAIPNSLIVILYTQFTNLTLDIGRRALVRVQSNLSAWEFKIQYKHDETKIELNIRNKTGNLNNYYN